MKRKKLIKLLEASGCNLLRHGSKHDIYINADNGRKAPIPRHRTIAPTLVKIIFKQLGIQEDPNKN